jgi:hypothetical protein
LSKGHRSGGRKNKTKAALRVAHGTKRLNKRAPGWTEKVVLKRNSSVALRKMGGCWACAATGNPTAAQAWKELGIENEDQAAEMGFAPTEDVSEEDLDEMWRAAIEYLEEQHTALPVTA